MPLPMLLLATFSAGLYARSRALAISGLPIALIAIVAGAILDTAASPLAVGIAILSALVCGAWTAGFLIRRPAQQITRERAQAPARARDAVAAERARFGARALRCRRSLGDGHLGSGRGREGTARSSARKGPHPHIEAVRRSAHDALVELRRLVGVLREDEPAYSPQPGLRHLGELLAENRATGLPIEFSQAGHQQALPAGLELAAYRIAQESLTNVRRHAGIAPTSVCIEYREDGFQLDITNAPGQRNGIIGPGSATN